MLNNYRSPVVYLMETRSVKDILVETQSFEVILGYFA